MQKNKNSQTVLPIKGPEKVARKPKPFLSLILNEIDSMDISPSGDYILVNALTFTLLIRITPISKLKYYLIPIHLMKVANVTSQTVVEEKKKEANNLEQIRKDVQEDPSIIP